MDDDETSTCIFCKAVSLRGIENLAVRVVL